MLMNMSQHLQVSPLPDILPWEVYHLCLVSRSLGFEPPEEESQIKDEGGEVKLHSQKQVNKILTKRINTELMYTEVMYVEAFNIP